VGGLDGQSYAAALLSTPSNAAVTLAPLIADAILAPAALEVPCPFPCRPRPRSRAHGPGRNRITAVPLPPQATEAHYPSGDELAEVDRIFALAEQPTSAELIVDDLRGPCHRFRPEPSG
jgi:hypothetical protein